MAAQANRLVGPRAARSEGDIAERAEEWEENVSRLARYGADYQLPPMFKKIALTKLLTGKAVDSFERWDAEGWSYDNLLKKVKEYARSRKLDQEASSGRAPAALNKRESENEVAPGPGCPTEEWDQQGGDEEEALNALNNTCYICGKKGHFANKCPKKKQQASKGRGKYKGKGDEAKGKGKGAPKYGTG